MTERIHLLPEATILRIAAGEVVERPASVLKELIENALDAHATHVVCRVEGAGCGLIEVQDDGQGMTPEDLPLSFARHATSKLGPEDDLQQVRTLGFRGEALAAIAAAADVTITSRQPGSSLGASCRAQEGRVVEVGAPIGTRVTVRDLFGRTPARRAFLKQPLTENLRLWQQVMQQAVSRPDVAFKLVQDDRVVLETSGSGSMRQTWRELHGDALYQGLREVHASDDVRTVTGLIANPDLARGNRQWQVTVINGRTVSTSPLRHSVEQAFQGMLQKGRYPVFGLILSLPPDEVDANVHPGKLEVRLRHEQKVHSLVYHAVRHALSDPTKDGPVPTVFTIQRPQPGPETDHAPALFTTQETPSAAHPPRVVVRESDSSERLAPMTVKGQIALCYILAEGADGLYLIDQHAAHERVHYDRLAATEAQQSGQPLLFPWQLPLDAAQLVGWGNLAESLVSLGMDATLIGRSTLLVRQVPAEVKTYLTPERLGQMLEAASERVAPSSQRHQTLALLACHSSVRAGDALLPELMAGLVRQLSATADPFTCPHGRPTLLRLSWADLEMRFGRRY